MSLFITNKDGQFGGLRRQAVCSVQAFDALKKMMADNTFQLAANEIVAAELILKSLGRLGLREERIRISQQQVQKIQKNKPANQSYGWIEANPFEYSMCLCWHAVSSWRTNPKRNDENLIGQLFWEDAQYLYKHKDLLSNMLDQAGFVVNPQAFFGISRSNKTNTLSISEGMDIEDPTQQQVFAVFMTLDDPNQAGYLTQQNGLGNLASARLFPSLKAIEIATKKNRYLAAAEKNKSLGFVEISLKLENLVEGPIPPGFAAIQAHIDQRTLQEAAKTSPENLQKIVDELAKKQPEILIQIGLDLDIETASFLKTPKEVKRRKI
jgi:hypothetical protein